METGIKRIFLGLIEASLVHDSFVCAAGPFAVAVCKSWQLIFKQAACSGMLSPNFANLYLQQTNIHLYNSDH